MKFGPVAPERAAGCVLAHGLQLADGTTWKKGRLLDDADAALLAAHGLREVVVARLGPDDVAEDEAAQRLATALAGESVDVGQAFTGRANLFAAKAGLVRIDVARVDAVNAVDPALTVATLSPWEPVAPGQMLATIKVIPYAAPRAALERTLALAAGAVATLRIAPFRGITAGLVLTRLHDTRAATLAKMRSAVHARLAPLGARPGPERIVQHELAALAKALAELVAEPVDALLVSGIAATVDREDVVPSAITAAGGRVLHVGMPVDPGNLLVLGAFERAGARIPVVGIPTCARSPKLNGFDFVLRRIAAGIEVGAADLMAMGVGGLLKEIPTRPAPRGAPG